MTQQTSIDVYNKIRESGLLSKRRLQVYEVVFADGPMTQNECWDYLRIRFPKLAMHSVSPRFAELKARGVIIESAVRECAVTGEKCITWVVTGNMPHDPVKPKSTKDQLKEALEEIETLKKRIVDLEIQKHPTGPFPSYAKQSELFKPEERTCSRCGTGPSGCIC